jgi:hypothetical protein
VSHAVRLWRLRCRSTGEAAGLYVLVVIQRVLLLSVSLPRLQVSWLPAFGMHDHDAVVLQDALLRAAKDGLALPPSGKSLPDKAKAALEVLARAVVASTLL